MSDSRLARRASVALVVLTALLLAAAAVSGYARSELVDERAFSSRAASALDDDDIRNVVAERVASGLTGSVAPDALIVRPLVVSAIAALADTPAFRRLFTRVVRDRHQALMEGETSFALSLRVGEGPIHAALRSVSPRVADAIPPDLRLPVVALDPREAELDGARVLNDVADWWWPLLAAALLAATACAVLASGVRDALVRLGIAVAGAGLLVAAAVSGLGAFVVSHAAHAADLGDESERDAVEALWAALFGDLGTGGLEVALGGVVVAVLAYGELPLERLAAGARRLREAARSASPVARGARAVVLIAAGAALFLEPGLVLRAAAGTAGVVLLLIGVAEIAARADRGRAAKEARRTASPLVLASAVLGAIAATVAAVALVLPAPDAPPAEARFAGECNGSAELCDRRLNEVVFPATHNSYAAAEEPGWLFASQRFGIERQLRDGIRALLIDVHYGARDPDSGRIRTDLRGEGSSRNKVTRELSPEALRAADRLAGRVGVAPITGERRPYLCHTLCELGAEPLDEQLEAIRRFLAENPGEVMVLFVEPYVPPAEIESAFDEAGLLSQAAGLPRDEPLPTLGELARDDTRLVVLAEEDGGSLPWYLPGFSFAQDTPLGATEASELSCERFRGSADSPLLLVNHWVPPFPPSVSRNERIGGSVLEKRLEQCEGERALLPNLVAVDFYERTGVVEIASRLNASRP